MSSVITTDAFSRDDSKQPLISEQFADYAAGFSLADVPAEVRDKALACLLDALGIGLASTTFEFGQRAANGISALGGPGDYPVIGMPLRLPLRDAVLLNGTLIHGLDFDDTHSGSVCHCTASAAPLVLMQALATGASGADALAAFILATEVDARVGAVAQGAFQRRGHHPTGMVGAFGATVAAAYLAGLPAEQMVRAQGIVLSMASGNLEFLEEGDWTKRMHPGWAGVSALTAVAMAGSGFRGPRHAYEGRYGLYNLHLGPDETRDLSTCTAGLGETWETMNVAFKPFPACHFNHAFADCALILREQHGIAARDIASVTARIHPSQVNVVCEPQDSKRAPKGPYEAQFSLHYVIAAALVRGQFTLDELDAGAYTDPAILDVAAKVGYEHDDGSAFPEYYSGEVTVRLKDGREFTHREQVNRGADARPLSREDIDSKFFSNAERAVSSARARAVRDAVMALPEATSVTALTEALTLPRA